MKPSSLESKTVRPGLGMYSFYHSDRHPTHSGPVIGAPLPKKVHRVRVALLALIVLLSVSAIALGNNNQQPARTTPKVAAVTGGAQTVQSPQPAKSAETNRCAVNSLSKMAAIDVSSRHMYACEGAKQVYDSPVITGMQKYASTLTPVGTYKVYAKQQDTVLSGADESGSWTRPVSYWIPFLDNEHGTYGFHDATWRNNNEFGKVDPNGDKASHGCVELPIAASAWLYQWADVGTTVTVLS